MGGLKRELKFDVKLHKLANVHEAITIAVQLDTKLAELKSSFPIASSAAKLITTIPTYQTVAHPGNLPVKKLTLTEIQQKRDKGECWFCNDKWVRGHKCGLKQLLMLYIGEAGPIEEIVENTTPKLLNMDLSECVFYGTSDRQLLEL